MLGKTGELHVGSSDTDIGVVCRKPCFFIYVLHQSSWYKAQKLVNEDRIKSYYLIS